MYTQTSDPVLCMSLSDTIRNSNFLLHVNVLTVSRTVSVAQTGGLFKDVCSNVDELTETVSALSSKVDSSVSRKPQRHGT